MSVISESDGYGSLTDRSGDQVTASGVPEPRHPASGAAHITVLGRFEVLTATGETYRVGRLQRRLLTGLIGAAMHGGSMTVDVLADHVYGDQVPPRPRRALATMVWRLRSRLGNDVIVSDDEGYRLALEHCVIDAVEFEHLAHRGSTLVRNGEDSQALTALQAAQELWSSGAAMALVDSEALASRLLELYTGVAEQLALVQARCGRHDDAIDTLSTIVTAHPERAYAQAQMIQSLLAVGAQAQAGRALDSALRFFSEQGVDPGPALQAAVDAVARASQVDGDDVRHEVAAAGSGGHRGSASDPDPTPTDLPLVGRDTEVQRILAAIEHARSTGIATCVVVAGEAGIGKTALTRAVLARISQGDRPPRIARMYCDPRRTLPYAPLLALLETAAGGTDAGGDMDSLRQLAGLRASSTAGGHERIREAPAGRGPRGAPESDRQQIHAALARSIGALAGESGLVLLAEDVHWAMPETLEVLGAVLASAAGASVVLLMTSRELDAAMPLHGAQRETVLLRGLRPAAVATLLGGAVAREAVSEITRVTGGNPLYITQLAPQAGGATTSIPDSLEQAMADRLRAVPPETSEVLAAAAVLGDPIDTTVLAAGVIPDGVTLPQCSQRLDDARRRGLVARDQHDPGRYRFVHALIRDHLYRTMPAHRRTLVHARVGRALRRMSTTRPKMADLLAHHYSHGWPEITTAEVISERRRAAIASMDQLDFRQAAEHYRAILDLIAIDPDATSPERTAQLHGEAGRIAAAHGDTDAAARLYGAQRDLAIAHALPEQRVAAALGAVQSSLHQGDVPRSVDDLAAAMSDPGTVTVFPQFSELTARALGAVAVYRPQRARVILDRMVAEHPQQAALLRAGLWEYQSVPDQVRAARQLYEDPAAEPVAAWLRLWASEVTVGARAFDDPPTCAAPVSSADDATRFDVAVWRITVAIATNNRGRARTLLNRAMDTRTSADAAETTRRAAHLLGQRLFLSLLDGTGGGSDATSFADAFPQTWVNRHPIMRVVAAYMSARQGDLADARARCDDLLDEFADDAIPTSDVPARLVILSDVCRLCDHHSGMEQCVARLQPHSGHQAVFPYSQYWGAVDLAIGKLHRDLGRPDDAVDYLGRAEEQGRRVNAVLYHQQAQRLLAEMGVDGVGRRS